MLRTVFKIFMAVSLFLACGSNKNLPVEEHDHSQADLGASITRWTDELELFAEFAPLLLNESAEAIVHLTTLADYTPVADGQVTINFSPHAGETQSFAADVARPGIFIAQIDMATSGLFDVEILFQRKGTAIAFDAGHLRVYVDESEMEKYAHDETANHSQDEESHPEKEESHEDDSDETGHQHGENDYGQTLSAAQTITFLKEQQWKTDFATTIVEERPITSSVMAVSEILPHQQGYADIVAPVDGLLSLEHNQHMTVPGTRVNKGDQLLVICPPTAASNTWLDRQLEYERATREFERAEKLLEREAISQREYEHIKKNYLIEKANYETLLENFGAGELQDGSVCLFVRSPLAGIVADVAVLPGQSISAGQRLLTVIDPSIVWIRSQIFEKDIERLGLPAGLTIRLQGSNRLFHFEQDDLELLSTGMIVDAATRTIPVVFKVRNPDNQLKIGQIVQTEIHTKQSRNMLAVPASALIDEDIETIVFVQTGGETFFQKSVRTGPVFGDWVAVTDGLEQGERVVSTGAYMLKLASANVSVGHAHVH